MVVWIFIVGILCTVINQDVLGNKAYPETLLLYSLVDEFFQWRISEWPIYATKVGISTYDDKVENFTEAAFLQQKEKAEELLNKSSMVNGQYLNSEDKVSLAILKKLLTTFIEGYEYREYGIYNFLAPLENIVFHFRKMVYVMPKKTIQEYQNILSRYRLLPQQITDMNNLMKIAVVRGTTSHTSSVESTIEVLDEELKNVTESFLFSPFKNSSMTAAIKEPERTNLQTEAANVIRNLIFPKLTTYKNYLQNEYYPHARTTPGVSSLPGGLDYYKAALKWHISLDMTPQEVHDVGLREVDRISNKMNKIMKQSGFEGNLDAFITSLLEDPNNYYATSEEFLQGYKDIIKHVHNKLGTILPSIPETVVDVMPNPQNVSRYSGPSADGTTPGVFWANVKAPNDSPKFNMVALTLHEAEPGHHTQATYTNGKLPDFRKHIEFLRYTSVPFNWLFHTSYSEGWALYAESLGEEMGVYTQPYSLFGRYSSEMYRATRLVVDTGMHAFGWSASDAENYMRNYTTLGNITIHNEVRRYISWPGQACAYKIGEIKIQELRKLSQKKLGPKFDLKKFHHEILIFGPVPLSILEEHIKKWIDVQLAETVRSATSHCTGSFITILVLHSLAIMYTL